MPQRFCRALTLCSCLLALAGCGDDVVLDDRDAGDDGAVPTDATAPDASETPDASEEPDSGPGVSCTDVALPSPTDPARGAYLDQYANPGVGGRMPSVGAIAFGPDGEVYVGGNFSSAGYQPASNVAVWRGATGWAPLGAGLPTSVSSLAVGDDGTVYAAHSDDETGAEMRISRWNGSSWTTVADTDAPISALAFAGGRLFVGGDFETLGGQPLARLAAYDGTSFTSLGAAPDGAVRAISAASATDVCIGGTFGTVGPAPMRQVACWDGSVWLDRSLPDIDAWPRRQVHTLGRDPSGALVAAGTFVLTEDGSDDGNLARWNGTRWEGIGGGVSGIASFAYADEQLYVGGNFVTVNGASTLEVDNAARWDGTAWHDMGGVQRMGGFGFGGPVGLVTAGPDGSVYFAGVLTLAGGQGVGRIARWDGTYWQALRTPGERYHGTSDEVLALARRGSCAAYVGGTFRYAGGVRVDGIARYDRETGYTALGSGVDGAVRAIHVTSDERVFVGGTFTDAATGASFRNVAVWDGSSWSGLGTGVGAPESSDYVRAIAVDETRGLVYVGGEFTAAGGERARNLAVWDGTSWRDLGDGLTGYALAPDFAWITSLLVDPETGDLVVAGSFSAIGTGDQRVESENVARWDGSTWHAMGIGGADGPVYAMTLWNGRIVVARQFTGDEDHTRFAAWNGTRWEAIGENGPAGMPMALDATEGALYVAGNLQLDGEMRHAAVFDGTRWSALGDGLGDSANAIAATEGGVLIGGVFASAGELGAAHITFFRHAD